LLASASVVIVCYVRSISYSSGGALKFQKVSKISLASLPLAA
jgi:hypothetical protein